MSVRRALARLPAVLVAVAVLGIGTGLASAWLAGWRLEVVLTGSMEPSVPTGALALTRPVAARAVAIGDVVSYDDPRRNGAPVLHRVIGIVDQPSGRFFEFQGDANDAPDPLLVPEERIENALQWNVPRVGHGLRWLTEGWHRWLLVAVPLLHVLLRDLRGRVAARRAPPEPIRPAARTACQQCGAPTRPVLVLRPRPG